MLRSATTAPSATTSSSAAVVANAAGARMPLGSASPSASGVTGLPGKQLQRAAAQLDEELLPAVPPRAPRLVGGVRACVSATCLVHAHARDAVGIDAGCGTFSGTAGELAPNGVVQR